MCFFPSAPDPAPPPAAAPQKTDADIQRSAENERLQLRPTQAGFASTILTGGFGIPLGGKSSGFGTS